MNNLKPLKFFEIVLRPCSLTYGVEPCSASLGVTGTKKCYNSPRTCQSPIDYTPGDEQIIRFCEPTEDLPIDFDAIPCITDISIRPQKVDPGESIGVRESGTVSMHNFKHNDVGFDKYLDDRAFNPYNAGTFWGKWLARWGNVQGVECRTVDGFVGQSLDQMERRYYVIESQSGPDSGGKTSFTFKDVLKLLDGDKAQAPKPSPGTLAAEIDETDTVVTLEPVGIGSFYPASGIASMGDEVVSFTRSGDVINLTGRNLYGSELDSHDVGETFQMSLVYTSLSPAAIINDLIINYSETPPSYIDLPEWETEVDAYIGRLYSAMIMRPTPVKTLINELVQEAGLIFFTNLTERKISLKAMRAFVPTAALNDSAYLAGSITSTPESDKRISEVWVYYGKRNPLEKQDEKKNYRAIYADITQNPVVALENTPASIREITSRWITVFNQPAASSVAEAMIARYEIAPRQVAFKLHPTIKITEGQAVTIESRIFENDEGYLEAPFQCQVLQIVRDMENITVLAEEVRFNQTPVGPDRIININENTLNLNLRAVHDSIYSAPTSGDSVTLKIAGGVVVGSFSSSGSLNIGDWPAGVTIIIDGSGRIAGKGGDAGVGSSSDGEQGGTAIYSRYPFQIAGTLQIYGGGGGGGGTEYLGADLAGGGGAGYIGGQGSQDGGLNVGGGGGGPITKGGDPGEAGATSTTLGGAAGVSIDGISYATITGAPDIKGAQIN